MVDAAQYLGQDWKSIPVTYNKKDLILYSIGIGCSELNFVYEQNDKFAMFPTFPIVLGFKGDSQNVEYFPSPAMADTNVVPPLPGVRTGLDGERYLEVLKPLPLEAEKGTLILKNRLVSASSKKKGGACESESLICGADGTEYIRMVSAVFLVGAKPFQSAGKSQMPQCAKPPQSPPDIVDECQTSPLQTHIYRLSGDYNPLHIDPRFAKMLGFKQPILHGLCTLGHAGRAVVKHFAGNDPALFKAIKVRFSAPVIPGETLVTKMWVDGTVKGRVLVEVSVKERNKVVVTSAFVDLHQFKMASSL